MMKIEQKTANYSGETEMSSQQINVIGFGVMGQQIAALAYLFGIDVCIYSSKLESENDAEFQKQVKKLCRRLGSFENVGSYSFCRDIDKLKDVITIECVSEDLTLKKKLYNQVKKRNTQAYFTNTSSYSPSEIAADVAGLHFFNPITLKFVELSKAKETNHAMDIAVNSLSTLFLEHDFHVINVKDNRGYIGNYVLFSEIASVLKLVEEYNYTIEQINGVYSKLYDGRDIFVIIDLIGVDVAYQILLNLNEKDKTIYVGNLLKDAMKLNSLGRKNKTSIKDFLNGF